MSLKIISLIIAESLLATFAGFITKHKTSTDGLFTFFGFDQQTYAWLKHIDSNILDNCLTNPYW